jgi:hypothetical protein
MAYACSLPNGHQTLSEQSRCNVRRITQFAYAVWLKSTVKTGATGLARVDVSKGYEQLEYIHSYLTSICNISHAASRAQSSPV